MKKIISVAVLAVGLTACKHEPVVPDSPAITYSIDIKPIINSNCTQAGCHGTVNPEFSLLSYDDVINNGEIKAGDPSDSKLYRVVTIGKGEDQMPRPPNPALSSEQIRLIYWWISQGAKNN